MEKKKIITKATITILDGRKAGTSVPVMFNPAEYSLEISNSFQETALPGLQNPILQFVNGNTSTLSMELFFDTWTDGGGSNVTQETDNFADMLAIDADLHAPPRVEFKWGGGQQFIGVIENLSRRFTMFTSEGVPVRATLSATFKQYRPISEQMREPRRNSADKTKRRVLTADDSLWALAAREYGHPREWRRIARHNRIGNPASLIAGDVLVLPPAEDV